MKRHNDKNIKEVLDLFMSGNKKLSEGFQAQQIDEVWKKRMGPVIDSYTKKISLRDGVLTVEITSAPLKKELLMAQNNLVDIINEELRGTYVKQIKIY